MDTSERMPNNGCFALNGGKGERSLIDIHDPRHRRKDLRTFQRAMDNGWVTPWAIDLSVYQSTVGKVVEIRDKALATGDLRTAATASDILRKFAADNMTLAGMLDKAERLDAGAPTENVSNEVRVLAIEPDKRG